MIDEPSRQRCAIAVMAKAPVPRKVKTRLIPPLTPEKAMALSASFLRDVTENIAVAARDESICGFVAFAPAGSEALFDGLLAPQTQLILADGLRDMPPRVHGFGCSLLHAAQALFGQGYESVCLLNSDSPTLPTALLREAAAALARPGDRVVLGPADDGGYYILGMKAAHAHLFEDVAWSTEHVARETAERATALGLEVVTLATWYDVDDRMSLSRLIRDLSPAGHPDVEGLRPYAAPQTSACIARLQLERLLEPPDLAPATLATGHAIL